MSRSGAQLGLTSKEQMSKKVAIVQSNYIPWKGYFDLIHRVDEFILLDNVQYTRRDWRNRNRIKTPNGPAWISIPVNTKGNYTSTIETIKTSGSDWSSGHWERLRQCYRYANSYDAVAPFIEKLYSSCKSNLLSEINQHFLDGICCFLGIHTLLTKASNYPVTAIDPNLRLIDLCRAAGADHYISGPSARAYLDLSLFSKAGIEVEFMAYGMYPEYHQPYPPFIHEVSILDLIFCTGNQAADHILNKV
jgi:hypothetical protein